MVQADFVQINVQDLLVLKRKEINQKVSQTLSGRKNPCATRQLKGVKRPELGNKIKKWWNNFHTERLKKLSFNELSKIERRMKILEEQDNKCCMCGILEKWNGKPLNFELDHISGDRNDNSRKNLRLICPNCHQQTPTYKGRNTSQSKRVSDKQVIAALLKSNSGYQCLKILGMSMHGKNYEKIRRVIKGHNIVLEYTV